MDSLNLQYWSRSGAMNRRNASGTPEELAADVSSPEQSVFCRQDAGSTRRFMERAYCYVDFQSQMDCGVQPKIARNELPWVKVRNCVQP